MKGFTTISQARRRARDKKFLGQSRMYREFGAMEAPDRTGLLEFQKEFAERRGIYLAFRLSFFMTIFGLYLVNKIFPGLVAGLPILVILLSILIGLILWAIKYWRCPVCEKHFGKKDAHALNCKHCGVLLRPEESES